MSRTKYVLVERSGTIALAVPKAILQDVLDSGDYGTGPVMSVTPITVAEIKRRGGIFTLTEEQFKRDMEHRARLGAFEQFRARYHGVTTDAVVLDWDHLRGEGTVRLAPPEGADPEGRGAAWPIYACNLPGRKTWYPETACVFYMPGETVQVKLDVHFGATFVIGVSQAYVDNVKWDEIKDKNLAFRVAESDGASKGCGDADGNAVNGLLPTEVSHG